MYFTEYSTQSPSKCKRLQLYATSKARVPRLFMKISIAHTHCPSCKKLIHIMAPDKGYCNGCGIVFSFTEDTDESSNSNHDEKVSE